MDTEFAFHLLFLPLPVFRGRLDWQCEEDSFEMQNKKQMVASTRILVRKLREK